MRSKKARRNMDTKAGMAEEGNGNIIFINLLDIIQGTNKDCRLGRKNHKAIF